MPHPILYLPGKIDFSSTDLDDREEPRKVFMVKPSYFDIVDVKNPYMEGHHFSTKKDVAMLQWQMLYNVYKDLEERNILSEVTVLNGVVGCEDMVFCANQSLPWIVDEKKTVMMSNMRYPSRQKEVPAIAAYYTEKGYDVLHLHTDGLLEGNGDVIPHPGKQLLWAGYGHRTSLEALQEVAKKLQVPVIPLKLVTDYFYHLDTCFVSLSDTVVMLCPDAFDEDSLAVIERMFEKVYPISKQEATTVFSLNAHCLIYPNVRIAILQPGSMEVKNVLLKEGFEVIETETAEYIRSGGSVFCMKMMYY